LKIDVSLKGRFKDIFQLPDPLRVEMDEGGNVRELLKLLCGKARRSADIFYNADNRLKPNVSVTRNGRFIIHLNWLDTSLSDGDVVTIFTLHCGG
jgi:molybdopterin converting factor small subunit